MLSNIRIVLVNTFHPGNIGAAARAMKNMGLTRLYLVSPRDYPSFEASQRASSATDVLADAVVVDKLSQALEGCSLVVGTTARLRTVQWQQLDSRECGELLFDESEQHEVALVFGRERTGLLNEELELCQSLVNIPTSEAYTSLNVASAVQVLSYEIFMASRKGSIKQEREIKDEKDQLATADQNESMYDHFFATMDQLNFFGSKNPEHVMRRIRCLFGRARPTVREVQIMHGLLSVAQGKKDKGKKPE
ncbi:MAG: RNA methyltransferase [Gammaproteobacteria bacterium]|nr:RNA methyltransferase [Gammaproteobacteria bacterium]